MTVSHTVRAGETFSSIARRYNLTNQTLKKLNPAIKNEGTDLKSDVTVLQVRVQTVHTVGPGDILSKVADKYKVSKQLIMAANGKTADRTIRGESLVIPYAEKQ
jgi:LysM repeat protein